MTNLLVVATVTAMLVLLAFPTIRDLAHTLRMNERRRNSRMR
jgi:hypothetical protein